MNIPIDYDPPTQEERLQAALDRFVEHLPVCGCCMRSVYPSNKFYELTVKKERLIVCASCKEDLDESEQYLEM